MYAEINNFANKLCESTNSFLEDFVNTKGEYLPLFLSFVAKSCYVKYDTLEEQITNIGIALIEKNGFIIEVDPIDGCVRSYVANQISGSVQMKEHIADTLLACVNVCWKKRLSTEYLVTMNGGGRYITADLFA